MPETIAELMSGSYSNIIASVIVGFGLLLLRRLLIRAISKTDDAETVFRARKTITYATFVVGGLALSWIWFDAIDNLGTYLGLVSAGIAIGLSDLLKNIVGWAYILIRRPFKIGDRIEIDGMKGDVIDIRLFRFSMMEVSGSFVQAEQATGRLTHVPNGFVFTAAVANYTEGFPFVWHEVEVLVTFESDWRAARALLDQAIARVASRHIDQSEAALRRTARAYNIKVGIVTPVTYLSVGESGVKLTGRFLIDPRTRRLEDEEVWIEILDGFAGDDQLELAYPTSRTLVDLPSPQNLGI